MADPTQSNQTSVNGKVPVDDVVETTSQNLLVEISKTLLSGTLATTRGAMQILQGLTGILLASYTTLLVGLGKHVGIDQIPILVAASPILFYALSLLSGFLQILLYRGRYITLGDLETGLKAYEDVVKTQRKQLILPLLLLLCGLISVVVVTVYILRLP